MGKHLGTLSPADSGGEKDRTTTNSRTEAGKIKSAAPHYVHVKVSGALHCAFVRPPLGWCPSGIIRSCVFQGEGHRGPGDNYFPSGAAPDVWCGLSQFNGLFCTNHGDNDASSHKAIDMSMT